jgi:spermidine synthase
MCQGLFIINEVLHNLNGYNPMIIRNMLRLLFCLTLGLHTSCVAAKGAYEYAKDIIDWVKSTDKGFVHDKVTAQRYDVDDPESPVGMYAVGDIRHGEFLMSIPREIIITAGDDTSEDYGGIWCPTAFNLIREMRLGDESKFAPYVGYLATQPRGQLPSAWSRAGQNLLQELLGRNDNDASNNLPPSDALEWIKTDWYDDCDGSDDLFEQHAALLLVQRGWDDLMIPLYDMMSHRNGKWLNTECDSVHGGVSIVHVRASRDIQAGEQLYTSYNFCTDCAGKAMGYGTPEILRDYGFVEQYPQRWFFGGRLAFLLDEDEAGSVQLRWLTKNPPTEDEDDFLLKALERLSEFEEVELAAPNPDIPSKELEVMKTYVNATMNAMKLALAKMNVSFFDESQCDTEGGSCNLEMRYDDLGWMEDDINYAVYTCDTDESMDMSGFAVLESLHSHYQKLDFYKDPKNDNVCFDISSVIQMCGSYRPMYHEMVVHYTARFLDKIERVMFVGGGDSMLLHDILKYPSLELVVGLELDQVVTRKSFKHFGTQPHFDNEKVQWWFGDAAKSLLMLPEEYFGSFDMVLVDLSETVMSFLVTDGLDIFQALSLLLKPKGILVKNELYLGAMSKIFDYR